MYGPAFVYFECHRSNACKNQTLYCILQYSNSAMPKILLSDEKKSKVPSHCKTCVLQSGALSAYGAHAGKHFNFRGVATL